MQEHEKKPIINKIIPEYDIAIVGGGMVGMALACFLGIFLQSVYVGVIFLLERNILYLAIIYITHGNGLI